MKTSEAMMPKDHMSSDVSRRQDDRPSHRACRISGATYLLSAHGKEASSPAQHACSKPVSFQRKSDENHATFEGVRSPCTIPCSCIDSSASATWQTSPTEMPTHVTVALRHGEQRAGGMGGAVRRVRVCLSGCNLQPRRPRTQAGGCRCQHNGSF